MTEEVKKTRGGKREGAGRKPMGYKMVSIRMTDEEKIAVKEFLTKRREHQKLCEIIDEANETIKNRTARQISFANGEINKVFIAEDIDKIILSNSEPRVYRVHLKHGGIERISCEHYQIVYYK